MLWKVDLHIHTFYSPDAMSSPQAIIEACREKGLDKIAITDHNTIAGALAVRELAPELVIIGEEVKTRRGELLALFIEEEIPPGLAPEETIELIKTQGGLVGISHPFDRVRREAMGNYTWELLDELDFIEAFNARTIFSADDERALELARERGIPASAGSDAHIPWEVGKAYVEMPPFNGKEDFLPALLRGRIRGQRSPVWVHLLSTWAKLRKLFREQPIRR